MEVRRGLCWDTLALAELIDAHVLRAGGCWPCPVDTSVGWQSLPWVPAGFVPDGYETVDTDINTLIAYAEI
jgi:hypothetical protein